MQAPTAKRGAAQTRADITDSFFREFLRYGATGVGVIALGCALIYSSMLEPHALTVGSAMVAVILAIATFALASAGRSYAGAVVLLYGLSLLMLAIAPWQINHDIAMLAPAIAITIAALGCTILSRRDAVALALLQVVVIGLAGYIASGLPGTDSEHLYVTTGVNLAILAFAATALCFFGKHSESTAQQLRARLADIDRVVEQAKAIALGDLSGDIEGDSEISEVIRAMLAGLRSLVMQLRETASAVASATHEISTMSREQEKGATGQAGAVGEIRETLEALLIASTDIADSTLGVVSNAELTLHNNELISDRISGLLRHTRRIGEILEVIKDIANKSELLALNASLEGAKAGEAGRGFSLVASQMQRLAERVMESVKDVKDLTADIRDATNATVVAAEEGTKLASGTTEAARQIGIITQQQRSSTEQVTGAMNNISDVSSQVANGASQTLNATRDLAKLADRLQQIVDSFRL